jgi:hypothetical protein
LLQGGFQVSQPSLALYDSLRTLNRLRRIDLGLSLTTVHCFENTDRGVCDASNQAGRLRA